MSTISRRQGGLFITIGLAAVAAVVAGFVLFTSSRATGVDLTTAKLVPDDAGAYIALNTDLSSSQWVAAFKLIERLGQEDPEDELKNSVEDLGNLDWEDDVAPFLGGNAAIYVKSFSISDFDVQGALIIKCKDAEKALKVVRRESGLDLEKDDYGGIDYWHAGETGFIAKIEDHLVVAFNEESLFNVIDVHKGKQKSLASVDDFKQLRDETTNNFLTFVYISTEDLAGGFLNDESMRKALRQAGAEDLVFQPMAWVLGAKDKGFEFQQASLGKSGVVSPMVAPRDSKLVKVMPGDATIFFSTANLAQTWKDVTDKARPQIDDAIRSGGEYRSLDDALRSAGSEIGLRSVEELIALFRGETAVGIWFPTKDENEPEVVLLAEVDDVQKAQSVIEKVAAASSGSRPRTEDVGGTKMTVVKDQDGEELAWAFKDGYLAFGTVRGVRTTIEGKQPSVAEASDYKATLAQMETRLGTFAYINLRPLLRLAENGVPAQLDEVEKALQGLILNVVEERGVVRFNGFLTVAD